MTSFSWKPWRPHIILQIWTQEFARGPQMGLCLHSSPLSNRPVQVVSFKQLQLTVLVSFTLVWKAWIYAPVWELERRGLLPVWRWRMGYNHRDEKPLFERRQEVVLQVLLREYPLIHIDLEIVRKDNTVLHFQTNMEFENCRWTSFKVSELFFTAY